MVLDIYFTPSDDARTVKMVRFTTAGANCAVRCDDNSKKRLKNTRNLQNVFYELKFTKTVASDEKARRFYANQNT